MAPVAVDARLGVGVAVMDATGRRCQTHDRIEGLGYEPPPVSTVEVGIRYVTQVYERTAVPERDWKAVFVIGDPATRRMVAAVPFEGDRWFVLLSGVNGEQPPTDREEALEWARSLDSPVVAEVMEASQPIGRRGTIDRTFARRYFRAVGRIVDDPWQIAIGGDFAYDGTVGPKPFGTGLMGRYMDRLAVAAQHHDSVALRIKEVVALDRSPRVLLTPRIAVRALSPS